jgi:hypothetical protein
MLLTRIEFDQRVLASHRSLEVHQARLPLVVTREEPLLLRLRPLFEPLGVTASLLPPSSRGIRNTSNTIPTGLFGFVHHRAAKWRWLSFSQNACRVLHRAGGSEGWSGWGVCTCEF